MFKLYRARHMRAEGFGSSVIRRIGDFVREHRNQILTFGMGAALAGTIFAGEPAVAYADQISDTTTPVTNEQVVSNENLEQSNDVITEAVEQTQTPVQSTSEVSTPAPVSEPVQSAPVQEAPIETETPVQETAPVQEVQIETETPVQETTPVENTDVSSEPVIEESTNVETQTDVKEQASAGINEEINSRVPEIGSEETSVNEDSKQEETVNEMAGINEEINSRVPEIGSEEATVNEDSQDQMGIVSENPVSVSETDTDQATSEVEEENKQEVTGNATSSEQTENTTSNEMVSYGSYQVMQKDGSLFIIGDIPEDQLDQLLSDLTAKYGEEAANGAQVLNYDFVNAVTETVGENVSLVQSGLTAVRDENGVITVMDADGNVVTSWQAQDVKEENQEVENTQEENDIQVSQDTTIPNDYVHKDFEVNTDEYLVIENADGSYTLALGGVGLSGNQIQDLISKLQSDGIIPADAVVTPGVLPSKPTDEMIEQGILDRVSQIGDYYIGTQDGVNYTVYAADGTVLDTIIKYQEQKLEENYDTSKDPDAEVGDKADVDEPGDEIPGDKPEEPTPDEPTPDEPTPDEPTPDEPTPDEPTPDEPKKEIPPTSKSDVPQTGDPTLVSAGIGALGAAAAGAAALKNRKDKKEDKGERQLTLIAGGKEEDTFNDLYKKYSALPNYDDLEAMSQAWTESKEGKEWRQTHSKGRTR